MSLFPMKETRIAQYCIGHRGLELRHVCVYLEADKRWEPVGYFGRFDYGKNTESGAEEVWLQYTGGHEPKTRVNRDVYGKHLTGIMPPNIRDYRVAWVAESLGWYNMTKKLWWCRLDVYARAIEYESGLSLVGSYIALDVFIAQYNWVTLPKKNNPYMRGVLFRSSERDPKQVYYRDDR